MSTSDAVSLSHSRSLSLSLTSADVSLSLSLPTSQQRLGIYEEEVVCMYVVERHTRWVGRCVCTHISRSRTARRLQQVKRTHTEHTHTHTLDGRAGEGGGRKGCGVSLTQPRELGGGVGGRVVVVLGV